MRPWVKKREREEEQGEVREGRERTMSENAQSSKKSKERSLSPSTHTNTNTERELFKKRLPAFKVLFVFALNKTKIKNIFMKDIVQKHKFLNCQPYYKTTPIPI